MAKKPTLVRHRQNSKVIDQFIRKQDHIESLQKELEVIRPEVEGLVMDRFNAEGLDKLAHPENFILVSQAGELECQLQKRKGSSPLNADDLEFLSEHDLPYDVKMPQVTFDLAKSMNGVLEIEQVRNDINDIIRQYLNLNNIKYVGDPIERHEGTAKYVVNDQTVGATYTWMVDALCEDKLKAEDISKVLSKVSSLHIHSTIAEGAE